jgi:hypothetical protein
MKKEKDNILTCIGVRFYCRKDEDAFFEWIKKIECIEEISATGEELYLHICADDIHDYDLRDLLGLFYRYKVEMKQLGRFLTDDNKKWFYENKKAFWHKKVFGTTSVNKK